MMGRDGGCTHSGRRRALLSVGVGRVFLSHLHHPLERQQLARRPCPVVDDLEVEHADGREARAPIARGESRRAKPRFDAEERKEQHAAAAAMIKGAPRADTAR
eukprot:1610552-Prymnesium_polylepis.1